MVASEFYKYDLDFKSYLMYKSFIQDYPVVPIEDPFDQDDWDAWQKFTASAGIQVVGDYLTVTSPKRITKIVGKNSCNCLLPFNIRVHRNQLEATRCQATIILPL